MGKTKILIVDDNAIRRTSTRKLLENHAFSVAEAGSLQEALKKKLRDFRLIIANAQLSSNFGTDIIPHALSTPVVVLSDETDVTTAVAAMKRGAADYLVNPVTDSELLHAVETLTDTSPKPANDSAEMIGSCAAMSALFEQIKKVAPTQTNVLIMGESGTGKELVARALHDSGQQRDKPMISLNCAAIPETLIESELFGHEKGAFTGASASRVGLVEAADGGTLFLDEIGELPMEAQARLLRVIQEGEIRKVGSIETKSVTVRLIAATHRDLDNLTKAGQFRADLYYRLNVVKLQLPPLRERRGDLLGLADHFLRLHSARLNKSCLSFSAEALQAIQAYSWPGNIRELKNAIERAVILSEDNVIAPEMLALEVECTKVESYPGEAEDNQSLEDYFARFVLDNQDHMTETDLAQKLGISRKSLWQRRQRLNIPRERPRKH